MASADRAAGAVRERNARDCLLALREASAPLTVAEVAGITGLSRPTVDSVVHDLRATGAVVAAEQRAPGSPGRPARRFRFEPDAAVVAAVDLGARSARCVLADATGRIVLRRVASSAEADRLETVTALIESSCTELAARADASRPGTGEPLRPRAVGVSVPGILTAEGRLGQSLALPDLVGADIGSELSKRLGCPVTVENDIKLAAYAEHHRGPRASDSVFIQIGHRISVALIVDGRILQGRHRLAGELGIQRGMRWTRSSERGRLRWSTGDTAQPLFTRAAEGDARALEEIEEFCAEIAPRIATLLLTVDPERLVVGGGLSKAGELLLGPLRRHVHHLLMSPEKPEVVAAGLATEGAPTGALGHAFEHGSTALFAVPGVPAPWQRLAPPPGRP